MDSKIFVVVNVDTLGQYTTELSGDEVVAYFDKAVFQAEYFVKHGQVGEHTIAQNKVVFRKR